MSELSFTANVAESNIYGINQYLGASNDLDIDTGKPIFGVSFELDIEARRWGIKCIDVTVRKIVGTIDWEVCCDELSEADKSILIAAGGVEMRNDTICGTIEIDSTLKVNDRYWEVENNATFGESGTFGFEEISVDLSHLSITLS